MQSRDSTLKNEIAPGAAPGGAVMWTPAQRDAICASGVNLLVSAGAGSGKTAVLAERCAGLVAGDAGSEARGCGIDRLLVVTFTDAAAAEMKQRIAAALRARLAAQPANAWIARQLALLDTSAICTLHSFCLRVLRRHFADADLDPMAPIMDAHESGLLKQDVTRQTLKELLEGDQGNAAVLELSAAYGGNNDSQLLGVIQSLNEFLSSLPDPAQWTREVRERFVIADGATGLPEFWRGEFIAVLKSELSEQLAACDAVFAEYPSLAASIQKLLDWISPYRDALSGWASRLEKDPSDETLDALCREFSEFAFARIPTKVLVKSAPADEQEIFGILQERVQQIRDRYFKRQLSERFGGYSISDWVEGIRRTAPFVVTLLDVAERARRAYLIAKRDMGVIDFSDQERLMLDLLADESNNIARLLRDQFEHVFVDEFQDISPIQAKIIEYVSRESDAAQAGNLFCVGDVKQSIYRFRLAEPRLFLDRLAKYAKGNAGSTDHCQGAIDSASQGRSIDLLENFRTRHSIIDAINAIFERIMAADLGGIAYDDHARLRAGRTDPEARRHAPVELCVLEGAQSGRGSEEESEDEAEDDSESSAHDWTQIEREAYAISGRIERLISEGTPRRDIVILLRSLQPRAASLIRAMGRLGIPAIADTAGGLFNALEVQDVLALLAVLDNPRQDIPLAAVLRSPMLGDPLSDDDLVAIRTFQMTGPFHEAVPAYAGSAGNGPLLLRLRTILDTLQAWREQSRLLPLADVLWLIYEQSGYLAYVQGLPDGRQRRANLVRLHEYARQFGTFQRQGLARFLAFIDGLRESQTDLDPGTVSRAAEDAVRVMTIHRAKGLEFPVVIVAELGKRFNLSDARKTIMFDRRLGLSMSAVDVERHISYPTLPHRLVADALGGESLAEELRVLYVALTRARDRLILIGTGSKKHIAALEGLKNAAFSSAARGPLPLIDRRTAGCALDWIVDAVASQGSEDGLFDVSVHRWQSMLDWRMDGPQRAEIGEQLAGIARLEPLDIVGGAEDSGGIELIRRRLTMPYAARALSRVPAVAAASNLKRHWETRLDAEEPAGMIDAGTAHGQSFASFRARRPDFVSTSRTVEANERGTWTHEFLQRIDFARPCDEGDLTRQLGEFVESGVFVAGQAREIDLAAVSWFFTTPVGVDLLAQGTRIYREWPFVIGVDPARYDPTAIARSPSDLLLVRGIVDCLYDTGDGWKIIDYKTDAVNATTTGQRAADYRGQLDIYDKAVSAAFPQVVKSRALVFLAARQIIEM
jgi:ATP-dependent helicase/nuclease subunit A